MSETVEAVIGEAGRVVAGVGQRGAQPIGGVGLADQGAAGDGARDRRVEDLVGAAQRVVGVDRDPTQGVGRVTSPRPGQPVQYGRPFAVGARGEYDYCDPDWPAKARRDGHNLADW